jgi:hypothetical protein
MDVHALAPTVLACATPPFDWAGPAGAIAAVVAVVVTAVQVVRDIQRERSQAIARAKSAKLLIGAFYASANIETRELSHQRRSGPAYTSTVVDQAKRIRDDQHLAILFQALLTIDSTALSTTALKPVGDAQQALVAIRNIVAALAAARVTDAVGHADLLDGRMQVVKTAFEKMRGEVPFHLDN